jgi:hypothetical protein
VRKTIGNALSCLALGAMTLASLPASAGGSVHVLILKEQGVGSAATAQEFVDKLMTVAAQQNGWSAAVGKYQTRRSSAESWIASNNPHFGIMSLGALLALQGKHKLEVIGKAEVAKSGGRQYHVISANQSGLAGCKGKTLATNHGADHKFVDKVIADGGFSLTDFTVVKTRRPMQTVKAVTKGEAECALVDDAQFQSMGKVDGGGALKSVWKSKQLPPMAVVAFPSAPAAEKATFKRNLGKLCTGSGKQPCKEVGIKSLKAASKSDYAGVMAKYGR